MAFSQSSITDVAAPVIRNGQVFLSWTSSAPAGTWLQVYLNAELAWFGQRTSVWTPVPSGPVRIDIGAVISGFGLDGFGAGGFSSAVGLEGTDYSSALPVTPKRRAELSWLGGYFEGIDLAGFHVYGEAKAGGGVNYAKALQTITAYPAGIDTSGFGLGGFGSGGFGQAAGTYDWTSEPLASGTWTFAVKPFDEAGNEGTAVTAAVAIAAPPLEPALYPDGITRLHYTLLEYGQLPFGFGGFGNVESVLTWNASPS